jgi:hypothetical protein
MVTAPAEGEFLPPIFVYPGKEETKDLAGGEDDIYWMHTLTGHPDATTMVLWANMVVKEKNERGLEKLLILCDNADVHANMEVIELFVANNIHLFTLISGTTGKVQPLDLLYFGPMKKKLDRVAARLKVELTDANLAAVWKAAHKELIASSPDIMMKAFAKGNLWPLNPDFEDFEGAAPGDLEMAHDPHSSEGKTLLAGLKEQGIADGAKLVEEAFKEASPAAAAALVKLSGDAKDKRIAQRTDFLRNVTAGLKPSVGGTLLTSAMFAAYKAAKAAEAAQAAADKAKRKEVTEANKKKRSEAPPAKRGRKAAAAPAAAAAATGGSGAGAGVQVPPAAPVAVGKEPKRKRNEAVAPVGTPAKRTSSGRLIKQTERT